MIMRRILKVAVRQIAAYSGLIALFWLLVQTSAVAQGLGGCPGGCGHYGRYLSPQQVHDLNIESTLQTIRTMTTIVAVSAFAFSRWRIQVAEQLEYNLVQTGHCLAVIKSHTRPRKRFWLLVAIAVPIIFHIAGLWLLENSEKDFRESKLNDQVY